MVQGLLGHRLAHQNLVFLRMLVAGVRQAQGHLAVAGQQEQPLGHVVKPSNGKKAFGLQVFGQQLEDGFAPLGVADRGHGMHRLVQHDVGEGMS
jgi:hypothetical protein